VTAEEVSASPEMGHEVRFTRAPVLYTGYSDALCPVDLVARAVMSIVRNKERGEILSTIVVVEEIDSRLRARNLWRRGTDWGQDPSHGRVGRQGNRNDGLCDMHGWRLGQWIVWES